MDVRKTCIIRRQAGVERLWGSQRDYGVCEGVEVPLVFGVSICNQLPMAGKVAR